MLRRRGVDTLQRSETTSVSFIAPGSVTNEDFGMFRWNMTAEAGGAGTHFHRTFSESFYALHGAVTLYDGTDWVAADEGDFLYVPNGRICSPGTTRSTCNCARAGDCGDGMTSRRHSPVSWWR